MINLICFSPDKIAPLRNAINDKLPFKINDKFKNNTTVSLSQEPLPFNLVNSLNPHCNNSILEDDLSTTVNCNPNWKEMQCKLGGKGNLCLGSVHCSVPQRNKCFAISFTAEFLGRDALQLFHSILAYLKRSDKFNICISIWLFLQCSAWKKLHQKESWELLHLLRLWESIMRNQSLHSANPWLSWQVWWTPFKSFTIARKERWSSMMIKQNGVEMLL